MPNLFKRIYRAGWSSFSRDGTLALANVFIMAIVISAITSLFLFRLVTDFMILKLEEKVDISVYFKYEALEEDILKAKEEVSLIPEVKEVNYVSKDEALDAFVERHKNDPVLMDSLDEVGMNPFLASLSIKSNQASQYEAVVQYLDNSDFNNLIEKVDYLERKPVIDRIFSLTSNINQIGIGLSFILGIVAILVAFNTIRLAIYNSREEIKIQRLVGASNGFIKGPFLVQGVISGFFAALICLLIFTLATWAFSSKMDALFPSLNLFGLFLSNFWIILFIQIAAGVGLGIISSLLAIKKYLEV